MQQSARSFRLTCDPDQMPLVDDLLSAQGFVCKPDPLLPAARLLLDGPLPLGSSLAARFGLIYIQDRSSMLPPLALAPAPGAAVLDMCASPGGKSGLLALMTGAGGFVLANEPGPKRLGTLRRNLQAQNLFNCATCSFPGESLPLPDAGAPLASAGASGPAAGGPLSAYGEPAGPCPGWQAVLLDPPCSGWGTAEKNPRVLRLWQGEKIASLTALQGRLLTRAAALLAPGALLSYSTCTTNVEENEDQVLMACRDLGFELVPLEPPPDFALAPPARPGCDGVWRVESGSHGQGFFVALLRKNKDQTPTAAADDAALADGADRDRDFSGRNRDGQACTSGRAYPCSGPGRDEAAIGPGFFVRPWEKSSRFVGERRRHGGRRGQAAPSGPRFLDRAALAGPWLDPQRLPPGEVAVFNGLAHFLPEARANLLPPSFVWKGFPLGRCGPGGDLRPFGHLRRLMPAPGTAPALVLEDIKPLLALVAGRGLAVTARGPEIGLYYKGLPLCRLALKGGRALLPAGS